MRRKKEGAEWEDVALLMPANLSDVPVFLMSSLSTHIITSLLVNQRLAAQENGKNEHNFNDCFSFLTS